jgi:hypothetical protein
MLRTSTLAALTLPLAIPAAASAAGTVAPSASCVRYVPTHPPYQSLGVSAAGWAPGSTLTFSVGGTRLGTGTTDPSGAFSTAATPFTTPEPEGNVESMTLTADDGAGGTASAALKVTRITVVVPDNARPSQRVRYRVFGFPSGRRLYLFVRRAGKVRARRLMGRPGGECGTLVKRLRYVPVPHVENGTYQFWFSNHKRFSKQTAASFYSITVS